MASSSHAAVSGGFFALLEQRCRDLNSLLCVGLDPHSADLADKSAAGAAAFCKRLIDATAGVAAAYKPNAAFFEVFGAEGARALKEVCEACGEVPVLLDFKRGDISTTADAYAESAYDHYAVDAVTINPYMGADSITPFTKRGDKGVFLLCKTSNPSAGEVQSLPLAAPAAAGGAATGGERVFERVARLAEGVWGAPHNNVGLVVGATDTEALAATRAAAPSLWILAPGVGFQGGDLSTALSAGLRDDGLGMLLPVSRGISRAADPAAAAVALRDSINAVRDTVKAARAAAAASAATTTSATTTGGVDLQEHQRSFIAAALAAGVLRFGSFTLKSGRASPYFFNAGNFKTGAALAALGRTYAQAVAASGLEFDVLFGPAYKGIPLVSTTAVALASLPGASARDVPFAFNRKEAKDHGEGGTLVGADVAGKRVLIVDDVITAGTAIGEAIAIITAAGGIPVGVVIGLDRQERGGGKDPATMTATSAVESVQTTYGIPVIAVATLSNLVAFIREAAATPGTAPLVTDAAGAPLDTSVLLTAITEYRTLYGTSGTATAAPVGAAAAATGGASA